MEFTFEDPAPSRGRGAADPVETEAARFLKHNPGRFARIKEFEKPETAQVMASMIRNKKRAAFKLGNYTAEARTDPDTGRGVVYVKYLGD